MPSELSQRQARDSAACAERCGSAVDRTWGPGFWNPLSRSRVRLMPQCNCPMFECSFGQRGAPKGALGQPSAGAAGAEVTLRSSSLSLTTQEGLVPNFWI